MSANTPQQGDATATQPSDGTASSMPAHASADAATRSRRARALRWLLIVISILALLTLAIGVIIGVRSGAWNDLPRFLDHARTWKTSPLAMLAMLGAFVAGGLIVFPVNLLIAAAIIVFGPVLGGVIALVGATASAALLHQVGRSFPQHAWMRFAGGQAARLRERVAEHGIIAVAIVRIVPIAPYSIVSVAAGAADIARVPYLIGTALGMAPGIVLYAVFADRAREVIADPRPLSWAMLFFALLLIVVVGMLLRRYSRRASSARGA